MKKNRSAPVRICLHASKLKTQALSFLASISSQTESGTESGSRSPVEWKTVDRDTFPQRDPRNQIKPSCINHNAWIPMTETDFPSIPDHRPWHVCRQGRAR